MAMAHATVALLTTLAATLCISSTSAAKILVYPFGHCLNSHLLNAEKLVQILSHSGHDVHLLISESYDRFEHHDDEINNRQITARHRRGPVDHLPCDDTTNVASSFSSCNDTSASLGGGGSAELVQFAAPDDYRPVCEYDSIDFMLDVTVTQRYDGLFHTLIDYCDRILADTDLLLRLKRSSYDLLIVEALDPCSGILADYLDVPFILLVTTGLGQFDPNPRPPSYLPAATAPFTDQMEFGERLLNVLLKLWYDVAIPTFVSMSAPFQQLRLKYELNTTLTIGDTFNRASLRFVNSDFTVDYPAPIQPDTVLVGGFAVDRAPLPLPSDLEQFVAESGDAGVVVASFGTLVRHYGPHWTRIFSAAFARLPQRVVWRHYGNETYDASVESSNVRKMRWLPQASLLAHPKTRLFISHCGLNAVFEAAHYGVPVLAIPLSADQHNHAAKLAGPRLGMAVNVDIRKMTANSLYNDIRTLLTDRKYHDNARKVSRLMADQPSTPADRVRFWVDYVVRHGGASHLHSEAARRLSWFQYWCLDVLVCLLAACLLFTLVVYRLLRVAASVAGGALLTARDGRSTSCSRYHH